MARDLWREALPFLLLVGSLQLVTGGVLGGMVDRLVALPGLLAVVPAVIGIRGNINTALGARLGSAIHMGTLDVRDPRDPILRANLISTALLSLIMATLTGVLAWAGGQLLGLPMIGLVPLTVITLLTGMISGFVLTLLNLIIAAAAVRWGLNPDNITGPLITTLGDILSVVTLVAVAGVVA